MNDILQSLSEQHGKIFVEESDEPSDEQPSGNGQNNGVVGAYNLGCCIGHETEMFGRAAFRCNNGGMGGNAIPKAGLRSFGLIGH